MLENRFVETVIQHHLQVWGVRKLDKSMLVFSKNALNLPKETKYLQFCKRLVVSIKCFSFNFFIIRDQRIPKENEFVSTKLLSNKSSY